MVNQGGANAQFKGSGTVNGGAGSERQRVQVHALGWRRHTGHTFRIRIWWEADGVENDVYDNGFNLPIGAGNIVIHTK